MDGKSVEMQVAIPRTQDAGTLQNQMSKQHERFQDSLAEHQLKEKIDKRRQVNEYEETTASKNDSNEAKLQFDESKNAKSSSNHRLEQEQIDHPYKGRRFDITR